MENRLCKLLGIKYPIIQGAMVSISTSELVSAVSNAGGLGTLACGTDVDALRKEIRKTRSMTDNPFAVNIPLAIQQPDRIIEAALEEGVKVIVTSAGNPALYTGYIKDHGAVACHVAPSVRLAKKCESVGVGMVIAEGWEAGGHNALNDVTSMNLIPQVARVVKIPVVAAGGIADAGGFIAAIALGAEGVQMGTRFIATKECIAHPRFKEAILRAADTDTVVTGRAVDPVRMLKNELAIQILEWERQGISGQELLERIGKGRTHAALIEGDMEKGSAMCGQVAGAISEILSVEEVIRGIVEGVGAVLARLNQYRP